MKIMFKLLIVVLLPLVCFESNTFGKDIYEGSGLSESTRANLEKLTETVEGCIIVSGWKEGYENGFDASVLTDSERALCIENGIKEITNEIDCGSVETVRLYSDLLARYYAWKEDHRKKMYWSLKGAENGSSFCMYILSNAYRSGHGVVQDLPEGVMWIYLGSAAGDDLCKQWIKEESYSFLESKNTAPIIIEAQKRANEWMNQHPDIFISRD